MDVKTISREFIKPSSPTPNHLRTYKISLLDQFAPPVFFPYLVFHQAKQAASVTQTSQLLKNSLSKTLSFYFPLAGRAIDNLSIDCNDEGACYINARVNCSLWDYLKQPVISDLLKFLPDVVYSEVKPGGPVAVIQETVFSCGGIAIVLVVPHTIFDAACLIIFMRTWAAIARGSNGDERVPSPNFTASSIFPQTSSFPQEVTAAALASALDKKNADVVVRRFVFDGSVVADLKAKAMRSGVQNPTRAEVVFAFLLKCLMSALKAKSGGHQKAMLVTQAVNMRRKAVPAFSETSVGNFIWVAAMLCQVEETEWSSYVRQMREAMSPVNGELLKRLQGDGGLETLSKATKELGESLSKALSNGAEQIGFNSFCNIGVYDADFGWGKPIWIPSFIWAVTRPFFSIHFLDTKHGSGIEAWLGLDEQFMNLLEQDRELLSLASLDPSPLEIGLLRSNL
ncbi:stemmadenine O-acetyltransferase-like [Tripterygium wilfordii]|uniref:stemmadenine O-acetyltransferase-like n=1 Tax=Tripterygium wilfordii TaxID=458696 RepID=UPI0018F8040F|nr:stemmadenine O-acetyltransferase-like [Tripterygium wilfordii]